MVNKSINLQKGVAILENGNPMAYFNGQIGTEGTSINMSFQITDKLTFSTNKDTFKKEFFNWIEIVVNEACINGWEFLKENDEEIEEDM